VSGLSREVKMENGQRDKMVPAPLDVARRDSANAALMKLADGMIKALKRMDADPEFLRRVKARTF